LSAYRAFLFLEGGTAFAFSLIATINLVWQAQAAHLNPLQLVLVGTVLEATALIGEVPTGVVADVYSRRLAIVLGVLLMGAGFLFEGLLPRFDAILLGQVVWGLGATFLSGATQAWISDEIGQDGAAHAFLRGAQVQQVGTLVAVPISVGLAAQQLNAPILVGAVLLLGLGVALALVMPERHFRPVERHARPPLLRTVGDGLHVVRGSPLLVTLLLLAAFFGMASEGFDRLWTPHVLDNFSLPALLGLSSITWFGVLRGGGLVLAIGLTELARRRLDLSSGQTVARALFAADTLRITSTVVFALTGEFGVAIGAFWVASVLRSVTRPIYTSWLNQQLESGSRATVLSMSGQLDALGQVLGGPAIGAVGTVSLRAALVITGLLLAPALALYVRALAQLRAPRGVPSVG
jgi:DHA3 family tetracycline resistance protein-like MFS transporter